MQGDQMRLSRQTSDQRLGLLKVVLLQPAAAAAEGVGVGGWGAHNEYKDNAQAQPQRTVYYEMRSTQHVRSGVPALPRQS